MKKKNNDKKSICIKAVSTFVFVLVASLSLFQCAEKHIENDLNGFGDNRVILTEIAGSSIDWNDSKNVEAELNKGNLWVEVYADKVNMPNYFSNGTGGRDHLYFFARGYDLNTGEITEKLIWFEIGWFELFRGNFYRLLVSANKSGRASFNSFSEKHYIYPNDEYSDGKRYVPYIGPKNSVVVLANKKYTDIFAFSDQSLEVDLGENAVSTFWDADRPALKLPSDAMGSVSRNIDLMAETYFARGNLASNWSEGEVSPNLPSDVAGPTCVEKTEGDNTKETTFAMIDEDKDGIPDCTEEDGQRVARTFFKHSLADMGAKVDQRDVFVEIDYMDVDDQLVVPQRQALEKAVESFINTGEDNEGKEIHVHFDVGNLYSETFSPQKFNLIDESTAVANHHNSGGGDKVPLLYGVGLHGRYERGEAPHTFYEFKERYFDYRKKAFSHYVLMVVTQEASGEIGFSGVGEVNGNDVMLSISWKDSRFTEEYLANEGKVEANLVYNTQASVLIHELGHNLGLRHGGAEDANYKYNYPSVMNYFYSDHGVNADEAEASMRDVVYSEVNLTETMKRIGFPKTDIEDFAPKALWGVFQTTLEPYFENEANINLENTKCLEGIFVEGIGKGDLFYQFHEESMQEITISRWVFLNGMTQGNMYGPPAQMHFDFSRGQMLEVDITSLNEGGKFDFNCDGDSNDNGLNLITLQTKKQGESEFTGLKQISDHNDWSTIAPSFGKATRANVQDGYHPLQKTKVKEKPMQRFLDDTAQEIVVEEPRRFLLSVRASSKRR